MEIKINNNIYKIYTVNPDNENLKIDNGDFRTGITNFVTKEIFISNSIKGETLQYTLLHELTHAMIDSYGFLQVEWNDEIVADFIGNYLENIVDFVNKMMEESE